MFFHEGLHGATEDSDGRHAVLFMSPVKMQIVGTIAKEVFSMQDLPPGRGKCPADVQF
jgi:hypothetical protein